MQEFQLVTNRPQFLNPKLEKITEKLMQIDLSIKARQFDIAALLAKVEQEKLFSDDGMESAVEYAEKTFGIKKTLAYGLVAIGTEYTRTVTGNNGKVIGHCSNLFVPADDVEANKMPVVDFTTTQIFRMLPLGRDKIVELIASGDLSPRMTVREIAEVVKANKPAKPRKEKEPEQATAPAPEPEQATAPAPEPEQATAPEPEQETAPDAPAPEPETIGTERGTGFDQLPTDVLIAELRLRGFRVYKEGKEMVYNWGE